MGQLFRDSVIIVLSTPCTMGTIAALLLNAVIPSETEDPAEEAVHSDPLVPLNDEERLESEAVLLAAAPPPAPADRRKSV